MEIRPTRLEDMDTVVEIYNFARQFMIENGNRNQWINGYPSKELIEEDIRKNCSYVGINGNEITGVFRFTVGIDPTYIQIFEGEWLNDHPYGVVHRIASADNRKGVASYCLNWCLQQCGNIRIDTHRDNIAMQKLLIKNGYTHCGIIYLEDGAERIAYQRSLQ